MRKTVETVGERRWFLFTRLKPGVRESGGSQGRMRAEEAGGGNYRNFCSKRKGCQTQSAAVIITVFVADTCSAVHMASSEVTRSGTSRSSSLA